MGFEQDKIATGLGFGSMPHNVVIKTILDDYKNEHFYLGEGTLNTLSCTIRNTESLKKLGLRNDGTYQIIDGFHFLPEEYLCPKDWKTMEMTNLTPNTISIHHYDASWKKWYDYVFDKGKPTGIKNNIIYFFARVNRFIANKAIKKLNEKL